MSKADLTCRDGSCRADDVPDENGVFDIYVHDTIMRHTRRVSQGHSRRDSDGPSYHPAISGDGRFVAFVSEASNLTHGARKRVAQIYVRNMETEHDGDDQSRARGPTCQCREREASCFG